MHYSRFCCCSVATSCPTLCNHMDRSTPGLPVHHHLLEFAQIHVHWVSDTIQPSCPLSSLSVFPRIRVFSNESVLRIRRPKYWSFSISPSNGYSGLISFRDVSFDLLVVHGTLGNSKNCNTPGFSVLHHISSMLKLMFIELVMPSKHLILCHSLLLLPSIFPSIRVFPVNQLFASGGQSIGASASVLPMDIQGWFPLGLNGLVSLLSKALSRVFPSTTVWKHQFSSTQPSLRPNSRISTWLLGKP